MDGDGHVVIHSGLECTSYENIFIGDNVWLASEYTILKGSYLKGNTIMATHGLVSKKFNQENILIGGNNKILQTDVG